MPPHPGQPHHGHPPYPPQGFAPGYAAHPGRPPYPGPPIRTTNYGRALLASLVWAVVIGVVIMTLAYSTLVTRDPESIKAVSELLGRLSFPLCATTFLTALLIWLIARNAPRPWPFIGLTGLALPIFLLVGVLVVVLDIATMRSVATQGALPSTARVGPSTTLTTPLSAGGLHRVEQPGFDEKLAEIDSMERPGLSTVAALYAQAGESEPYVVFIGAQIEDSAPVSSQAGVELIAKRTTEPLALNLDGYDHDAGPLGGDIRCGTGTSPRGPVTSCYWTGQTTFGQISTGWPDTTTADLAKLLRAMRADIERPIGG